MNEFAVEMQDVVKQFITPEGNELNAVDHVTMQISNGEFFSMLGSSGCGKTTSLRMIAGFEWPTQGEVYISGRPMGHTPPFQRKVNTVFQSYALFQHMTVYQNVAFGLEMEGADKNEIQKRVKRAEITLVQLIEQTLHYCLVLVRHPNFPPWLRGYRPAMLPCCLLKRNLLPHSPRNAPTARAPSGCSASPKPSPPR